MAMFEQMRANVGKLLKGIDRSELGWRVRSGQAGWRRQGASQGWPGLRAQPEVEFSKFPSVPQLSFTAATDSQCLLVSLFLPAIKRQVH